MFYCPVVGDSIFFLNQIRPKALEIHVDDFLHQISHQGTGWTNIAPIANQYLSGYFYSSIQEPLSMSQILHYTIKFKGKIILNRFVCLYNIIYLCYIFAFFQYVCYKLSSKVGMIALYKCTGYSIDFVFCWGYAHCCLWMILLRE